jgi:hypothetical protein
MTSPASRRVTALEAALAPVIERAGYEYLEWATDDELVQLLELVEIRDQGRDLDDVEQLLAVQIIAAAEGRRLAGEARP